MKKTLLRAALPALVFLVGACDRNPTTSEITTTPTLRSVTVSSTSSKYKTGDFEVFTAVANMSDGSRRAIGPGNWTTDAPGVATVDAGGTVTIVGPGSASIGVTYEGMTGAKSIQAFPSWAGPWQGAYRVDACAADGDFLKEGFCQALQPDGTPPISFDLTQTGDSVSGTVYHGAVSWAVSGRVEADGRITLSGRYTGRLLVIDAEYEMKADPWLFSARGVFRQHWTEGDMTGFGDLQCSLIELSRSVVGPGPLGAAAVTPAGKGLPLKDIIRALGLR